MIKTKIVETTEKFDGNGKLVEKITREETREDDTVSFPSVPNFIQPNNPVRNWEPYCTAPVTNTQQTTLR